MNSLTQMIEMIIASPMLAIALVGLFGLLVGSFLNVVIHRVPLMMEQEFKRECEEYQSVENPEETTPLTLSKPASHCPNCQSKIRWYQNVPVVSWLYLRGKCANCANPISFRYPLVEIISAVLSVAAYLHFGPTLQFLASLGLLYSLISLTGIDYDHQLLPDRITLPLCGAGLLLSAYFGWVTPTQSIYGAIGGFVSLWLVYKLFLLITGKHGMGYGDFKLLAALGAWLGVSQLPLIILLGSLIGSVIGVVMIRLNGASKPFAFGPSLAIGGIISLFFGQSIMQWYLGMY